MQVKLPNEGVAFRGRKMIRAEVDLFDRVGSTLLLMLLFKPLDVDVDSRVDVIFVPEAHGVAAKLRVLWSSRRNCWVKRAARKVCQGLISRKAGSINRYRTK